MVKRPDHPPRKGAKPGPSGRGEAKTRRTRQGERDTTHTEIQKSREQLGVADPPDTPQGRYHYTIEDQVEQLAQAREADAVTGFINRVLAVCALPRNSVGLKRMYVRETGSYTLALTATNPRYGLPFGVYPRLLFAWICTETVRTQQRQLVLGRSLNEFMTTLGIKSSNSGGRWGVRTRFTNQMQRLFACAIHMEVRHKGADIEGITEYAGVIAERRSLWWDPRDPDQPMLWSSSIELNQGLYEEIIGHSIPLDLNILRAIKRSPLAIDLYVWLTYTNYRAWSRKTTYRLSWHQLYRQFGKSQEGRPRRLQVAGFRNAVMHELKTLQVPWPSLRCRTIKGTPWHGGYLLVLPTKPLIEPRR